MKKKQPPDLRFFDAFSGVGGFALGAEMSGPGAICVGYSENEPHASAVSLARFPHVRNYGDATKLRWDGAEVDLLTGGVPCQSWSIAGTRGGFDDDRGKMWHAYARLLREIKPRAFIAENVKGILSHDGGKSFARICRMLAATGYEVSFAVLNAHDFGVPQNRERVFIVGFREKGLLEAFSFPHPTRPGTVIADVLEDEVDERYFVKPETAKKLLDRLDEKKRSMLAQSSRVFGDGEAAPPLQRTKGGGSAGRPVVVDRGTVRPISGGHALTIGASYKKGHDNHGARTMILHENISHNVTATEHARAKRAGASKNAQTILRWQNKNAGAVPDDVAPSLRASGGTDIRKKPVVLAQNQRSEIRTMEKAGSLTKNRSSKQFQMIMNEARLRRLTPVECERLMGWPDGWTRFGAYQTPYGWPDVRELADTNRYMLCGNGVAAPVVAEVVRQIRIVLQ